MWLIFLQLKKCFEGHGPMINGMLSSSVKSQYIYSEREGGRGEWKGVGAAGGGWREVHKLDFGGAGSQCVELMLLLSFLVAHMAVGIAYLQMIDK